MRQQFYTGAIVEAQLQEMMRDDNIMLMGIDIRNIGSAAGQTAGIYKAFPEEVRDERVFDCPISEMGYTGAAVGLALGGVRTICELQFGDFSAYAFDPIVNQAAKLRYLNDGKVKVPLVIRMAHGGGFLFGAQHQQIVESWFANVPGLKMISPTTPYDAKGLLISAIRDDDPVLFLESKACLYTKGECPEELYTVPIGKGKVVKEGADVTVIAWQSALLNTMAGLEELAKEGIDAEIIDPRTLVPLDIDLICESVKKTGRVVICHEAPVRGGYGGEIAAQIAERCQAELKAPIKRVGAKNIPIPFGYAEKYVLPQRAEIVAAVKETMK